MTDTTAATLEKFDEIRGQMDDLLIQISTRGTVEEKKLIVERTRTMLVDMTELARRMARRSYAGGDRVRFTDRRGNVVETTIVTVNEKTATCEACSGFPNGVRVPFGMLTPAEEA
jgi:hypothetical protein